VLVAVFHRNELSFNQEYEAERGAFEMTMLQQKVRDGDTPSQHAQHMWSLDNHAVPLPSPVLLI
jgi:hypothetical protein